MKLSANATRFLAANQTSPVVRGSAIGSGGEGARYMLEDGHFFVLSAEECRQVGMPRWKFD